MKRGSNVSSWGEIEPFRDDIVTIGDDVIIGSGTVIITHCPIRFYNGEKVDIVIGSNVYLGRNCIVLPGITIGDNVVIGAGSVVTGDIPSNVIAAGNPCRPIRAITEREAMRVRLMTQQQVIATGAEPRWS